ncbi:AraC family transcriptional regulator [Leminorella grimontii]|uniref:AraC family transcriptional regulator n=1 Tax=Leminorella grimontii TaxID=82981 RepID=A0AAV5N608_9GAMM|nr:helix-turn-helix domain-containing protein [Leminorella grimontii]KFC97136.1 AraC family transcriptional regulator [Leminorella grimontii ATCC 33999 = DSM 5078]GKX57020.1 AraC family transcriptional regulator [Leminorella grimontii]
MSVPSVAVVATDGFSPFHFSVPCTIFGSILPDQKLYNLLICAQAPGPVRSTMGLTLTAEHGLEALEKADTIVIPFWPHPEEKPAQALLDALIKARDRGTSIVGLCLGTYVLAYAGLLAHRRAATHWEYEQDFCQRFPDVRLDTNALYVNDDGLITSAGTAAGLDCCLYIVRERYGSAIANRIARRMVVPPHREGGQAQFIDRPLPLSTKDVRINTLLAFLRKNLQQPHSLDALAKRVMMSRRTFTRQFNQATGMSVGEWLETERLQRAQELLESANQSIESVAQAVGFQSPISFRQRFKARYRISPSDWRRAFRGKAL